MLRRALLSTLLLLFALGYLLPGSGDGLLLCIEGGPGGHVAIERGPCGGGGPDSSCEPASGLPTGMTDGTCDTCLDIPLGGTGIVRLTPPAPAVPLPAAAGIRCLPPVSDAPVAAPPQAPPPGTRTPVRLRT